MYNGIGLSTTRGSATSGYVNKNLSYVKPDFFRRKIEQSTNSFKSSEKKDLNGNILNSMNPVLLEHNRKHMIESKVLEMREELEGNGKLNPNEIEEKCKEYRNKLNSTTLTQSSKETTDSHEVMLQKEIRNKKLFNAFNFNKTNEISYEDYKPGRSFDPEYQEQQKNIRIQKKQERDTSKQIMNISEGEVPRLTNGELREQRRQRNVNVYSKRYRSRSRSRSWSRSRSRSRSYSNERYQNRRSRSPIRRKKYHENRSRSPIERHERYSRRSKSPIYDNKPRRSSSQHYDEVETQKEVLLKNNSEIPDSSKDVGIEKEKASTRSRSSSYSSSSSRSSSSSSCSYSSQSVHSKNSRKIRRSSSN